MIQQDSIIAISDTVKSIVSSTPIKHPIAIKVDSAAIADSIKALVVEKPVIQFDIPYLFLQKPDSSAFDLSSIIESFKPVSKIVSGFEGILHPMLPQTATWVFGVLLTMFILLVISLPRYSKIIFSDLKTYFQNSERSTLYRKTTLSDFYAQFVLIIFAIGVFSLFAYLYVFKSTSEFYLEEYCVLFGVTILFFLAKYILILFVGSVFIESKELKIAKFSYFNIISLVGILLYPMLVMRIYSPTNFHYLIGLMSLSICVSAYILIIIKLFQLFLRKVVASFYILLYLCTLEFLPLFIMYKVYQLIV